MKKEKFMSCDYSEYGIARQSKWWARRNNHSATRFFAHDINKERVVWKAGDEKEQTNVKNLQVAISWLETTSQLERTAECAQMRDSVEAIDGKCCNVGVLKFILLLTV